MSTALEVVRRVRNQCTMMQDDEEIVPFLEVLRSRPPTQRRAALEIGLSFGGTHLLFASCFERVVSVEKEPERVTQFLGLGRKRLDDMVLTGTMADGRVRAAISALSPFDLLFIDADHEYAAVMSNYLACRPYLAPGALIAFHDAARRGPGYGVADFLADLASGVIDGTAHTLYGCPSDGANLVYEVLS